MRETIRIRVVFCLTWLAAVAGCARYDGSSLNPGQSTLADVEAAMGAPAIRWVDPDHSVQLSYPRGPAGFHSFMVYLDPAGRLVRIQNVMDPSSFYRIEAGMDEKDVLRILGPSVTAWTGYFPARRELVWEWRYCDGFNHAARFDVLFDANTHKVRSSYGHPETETQLDPRICAH
jgi:hypothetical protein